MAGVRWLLTPLGGTLWFVASGVSCAGALLTLPIIGTSVSPKLGGGTKSNWPPTTGSIRSATLKNVPIFAK